MRKGDEFIDVLLSDLPLSGPTEIRSYVSRYVIEAPDPRRAVPDLIALRDVLDDETSSAVTLASKFAPVDSMPRLAWETVRQVILSGDVPKLSALVHRVRNKPIPVSEESVQELLSKKFVDATVQEVSQLIGAVVPAPVGKFGGVVLRAVAKTVKAEVLASISAPTFVKRLIMEIRPEVAALPEFWSIDPQQRPPLIQAAHEANIAPELLLRGLSQVASDQDYEILLHYYGEAAERPIIGLLLEQQQGLNPDAVEILASREGLLRRLDRAKLEVSAVFLNALAGPMLRRGAWRDTSPKTWRSMLEGLPDRRLSAAESNLAVVALLVGFETEPEATTVLFRRAFEAVFKGLESQSLSAEGYKALAVELSRNGSGYRMTDKLLSATIAQFGGPHRVDLIVLQLSDDEITTEKILLNISSNGGRYCLESLLVRAEAVDREDLHQAVAQLRALVEKQRRSWWSWY